MTSLRKYNMFMIRLNFVIIAYTKLLKTYSYAKCESFVAHGHTNTKTRDFRSKRRTRPIVLSSKGKEKRGKPVSLENSTRRMDLHTRPM